MHANRTVLAVVGAGLLMVACSTEAHAPTVTTPPPAQDGVVVEGTWEPPSSFSAVAIPPKTTPEEPLNTPEPPPPPPVTVHRAVASHDEAPATTTGTTTKAPAQAPAAPSIHDLAVAYAAQYGCGGVPVVKINDPTVRGSYNYATGAIEYTDAAADSLRYTIGHECMHARQEWAYDGDASSMQWELESVGGFEAVADCMSQFVGAGSGYYASNCGGALGDAATALLKGNRYTP